MPHPVRKCVAKKNDMVAIFGRKTLVRRLPVRKRDPQTKDYQKDMLKFGPHNHKDKSKKRRVLSAGGIVSSSDFM